ncbi:hypothetical protein [Bacillus amyloliquefaciens]|uniref:hypothetical protein n=1 Tax=Bacillus amyloliquefaciens TaxID=1390 RepID=UPI000E273774|nr:hypothetical protein [Bacillus amyloliquefaciens]RDY83174.1 hypothetical protein C3733_20155 [Bacillus amyloliquefaciens]
MIYVNLNYELVIPIEGDYDSALKKYGQQLDDNMKKLALEKVEKDSLVSPSLKLLCSSVTRFNTNR